jgi:(1->4)-alpha-D-glucan 1-alpha-D-glucosylmutase
MQRADLPVHLTPNLNPRCTYRLQLSSDFPFQAAADCAKYVASLGVSHLYCSPVLQAAPGSSHGYDVVDPTRINDELGGEPGFHQMVSQLRGEGLDLMIDIVPNHMATVVPANRWWWDILKHGLSSRYAGFFDINWEPPVPSLKGKVLLGVLSDRYGRELESGRLALDRQDDEVIVRYHDDVFPVSPASLDGIDVDSVVRDLDAFDSLLQRQHYRLAYWRTAQAEVNYRRFFTIHSLIGLRVEVDEVLRESHRVVFDLAERGQVAGLRVDHIDGLIDPLTYLGRIREAAPNAYLVVEKILDHDERLSGSFPVDGTTGYDFIAHVDGLFVDSRNEEALTSLYHAFTGESQPFSELVRTCKHEIMTTELSPDLQRLTNMLVGICERYRGQRDRIRRELWDAVRELATAFTVYRTYIRPGTSPSEEDIRQVTLAVEETVRRRPDIEPDLLAFISDLLLLKLPGSAEAEFVARFQQFTPAVMAKGVEDTAFYRYHRLVSLNEVGGNPAAFGRPVDSFHDYCSHIAKAWPKTMITLSTHDTKRSADVRARLHLLSEMPAEWEAAVRHWAEHNERYRSQGYPDRNLEYLIYQTLVGAWPIDAERLKQFLLKAAREGKAHTSWIDPVPAYEDAIAEFVNNVMADGEFMNDLQTFIGRNQLVPYGRITSLAQTALLLTCPGVPDLYQGSELWDLSLVDPDNRRPVDFQLRRRLLSEIQDAKADQALARADEGVPKLWLVSRLLRARRERPELFGGSGYSPLVAHGAKAHHAVSFVRDRLLVVVPRLLFGLAGDWADTTIELPKGRWKDLLTGREEDGEAAVALSSLLNAFPVAVLARERE